MTAKLGHGVPDTEPVWREVVSRLNPYAAPAGGERLAHRTGARFVTFPERSHWWPLERPAEAAAALERFWNARR